MTQLARPDLARNRAGRENVRPGPASAGTGPLPVDRSGLLQAGRSVPGWAVGTALLAPVVLVGGWLIADAIQPASYSPMRQTMSVLAGQSGTDRWVMTAALLLVGGCQIATGAGLTAVRMPARVLLVLTGLSTLGIAGTPEPATGPTSSHLAFAVSCVVTTAVWPVLVARHTAARSWILSVYGCATVTVVFAGLSCWLLIAARAGGGDLGLAERLTSAVLGLFPLVVALALRQTAPDAGSQGNAATTIPGTGKQLHRRAGGQFLAARRVASIGKPGADIRQAPRDCEGTSPRSTLVAHEQTTRGIPELPDLSVRTGRSCRNSREAIAAGTEAIKYFTAASEQCLDAVQTYWRRARIAVVADPRSHVAASTAARKADGLSPTQLNLRACTPMIGRCEQKPEGQATIKGR